ncbi:MAG: transposase, partial [Candidatus Bipolaricaulia bacterium]
HKVRVVAVVGHRGEKPVLLVSTDRTLDAAQIIELYAARFTLEITIRDLKQLGIGDYQCTTPVAIERFVRLCCVAFCVGRLLMVERQRTQARVSPSRMKREGWFSFHPLRRWLRGVALREMLLLKFGWDAEMEKVEEVADPLMRMVA